MTGTSLCSVRNPQGSDHDRHERANPRHLFFARAGLDPARTRALTADGAAGAWTMASCSSRYSQTSSSTFDDGRLKSATFDRAGLRLARASPAKRAGYAHAATVSRSRRSARAADDGAAVAGGHGGRANAAAARHQPRRSTPTSIPLDSATSRAQGEAAGARSTPMPRAQGPARASGHRVARRVVAGGRDPARRRRAASPICGRWCGSMSRWWSSGTGGAESGRPWRRRPRRATTAVSSRRLVAGGRRRGAAPGAGQSRRRCRRRPAR